MGNTLPGKKSAKVMKINGETFKLKAPVQAGSVTENHPGHVLLESDAVRHYGVRAKPLEPHHELKPSRLYFLVALPKLPEGAKNGAVRRVRSGIHMSAKDRLESMMLARRSASDLSNMKQAEDKIGIVENGGGGGGVRVRVRLPRAEVERLVAESEDGGADVAEKIVGLYKVASAASGGDGGSGAAERNVEWKRGAKSREKRVGFLPIDEAEIHLAVAS